MYHLMIQKSTRDKVKIVTLRSIRNDPLGKLHSHRQLDEAQYQGGRAFQEDWEKAERGPQDARYAPPIGYCALLL